MPQMYPMMWLTFYISVMLILLCLVSSFYYFFPISSNFLRDPISSYMKKSTSFSSFVKKPL